MLVKRNTIIVVLCFSLTLPGICLGANHYIRDGATGANNGANWTDAWDDLPSTFVRGDTYYVADGAYGGHTFNTAVSGNLYIYIKKATASDHGTGTGWVAAYGDGTATFTGTSNPAWSVQTHNWEFNGAKRNTAESGHGFKLTTSFCPTSNTDSYLFFGSSNGLSNITLKYMEFEHCGEDQGEGDHKSLYVNTSASWFDNFTIAYNYFHDVNVVHFSIRRGINWLVEHNVLARRHTNGSHHGEHVSWNNSGLNTNNVIRYNTMYDSDGTGTLVIKDSVQSGFKIYGNVFYDTSNRYRSDNGVITDTGGDTLSDVEVYNNTFYNVYDWGGDPDAIIFRASSGSGNIVRNNIVINGGGVGSNVDVKSHNLYNDPGLASAEPNGQYFSGSPNDLFNNAASYDLRLITDTDPGYVLPGDVSVDSLGNQRGGDGLWDRGAYEFSSDVNYGAEVPRAPTNLQIIEVIE